MISKKLQHEQQPINSQINSPTQATHQTNQIITYTIAMNKSPQERQCTLTKTTQSCDNSLAHVPICLPNRTLPHPTYTNHATNAHLIPLSMHKIMHSHTESCNRRTLKLRKFTETHMNNTDTRHNTESCDKHTLKS